MPTLWYQWAQVDKKHDLRIIQEMVTEFAALEQNYTLQPPIILAQLCQELVSFTFVGATLDAIKCGLHLFVIAYESDAHQEVMIANSSAYSMISESALGISLHDLEALKDKEVKHVPVT